MFGKKTEVKNKLIKKEVLCCECWNKFSEVYVSQGNEETFKDMYIMCPICFANLARRANKKGDK